MFNPIQKSKTMAFCHLQVGPWLGGFNLEASGAAGSVLIFEAAWKGLGQEMPEKYVT